MNTKRKIIEINEERCDGCGQCVTACAEAAIEIVDGKAKIVRDIYCDGLGACIGECPRGALRIIEREAPEFDPEAVEERLKELEDAKHEKTLPEAKPMACGCPSSQIRMFGGAGHGHGARTAAAPGAGEGLDSALTHWPVQIRLVPPTAPFLKGADLLVVSDCAPLAYPNLHRDFLPGRVVLLGCPKFDDGNAYAQKFAEIFATAGIRSVTVLDMEVPCCSAMPIIVKKGMELSGKQVPLEEVTVSVRGEVIRRKQLAA